MVETKKKIIKLFNFNLPADGILLAFGWQCCHIIVNPFSIFLNAGPLVLGRPFVPVIVQPGIKQIIILHNIKPFLISWYKSVIGTGQTSSEFNHNTYLRVGRREEGERNKKKIDISFQYKSVYT